MQNFYIIFAFSICVGGITVLSLPGQRGKYNGNIQPRAGEAAINQTIEDLRPNISNPIALELELNLALNDTLISGTLDLINPSIYGINGLLIPYMYIAMIGTVFNFVFVVPVLEVRNLLNTDINILGVLPVTGSGDASITLNNLQIKGHVSVNLGNPVPLSKLTLEINLESIALKLSGLLDSESFSNFASTLMTQLANDLIVTTLNDDSVAIGETLSPIIEDAINQILNGTTNGTYSEEVEGMITNFATVLTQNLGEDMPYDYDDDEE